MQESKSIKGIMSIQDEMPSLNLFLRGGRIADFQREFSLSRSAAAHRINLIERRLLETIEMPIEVLNAIVKPRKRSAISKSYYDTHQVYYSQKCLELNKLYDLHKFYESSLGAQIIGWLFECKDPLADLKLILQGKLTDFQWNYVKPSLGARKLRELDARNVSDRVYIIVSNGKTITHEEIDKHEVSRTSFIYELKSKNKLKRFLQRMNTIPSEPVNYLPTD